MDTATKLFIAALAAVVLAVIAVSALTPPTTRTMVAGTWVHTPPKSWIGPGEDRLLLHADGQAELQFVTTHVVGRWKVIGKDVEIEFWSLARKRRTEPPLTGQQPKTGIVKMIFRFDKDGETLTLLEPAQDTKGAPFVLRRPPPPWGK